MTTIQHTKSITNELIDSITKNDPELAAYIRRRYTFSPLGLFLWLIKYGGSEDWEDLYARLEEYRNAIVLKTTRPVYSIINNQIEYNEEDPESAFWVSKLEGLKGNFDGYFSSVGRIDIESKHEGTGWFIETALGNDIVATAGHVADAIKVVDGKAENTIIDMNDDASQASNPAMIYQIAEVVSNETNTDLAFLRVARDIRELPKSIPLCKKAPILHSDVLTIGYPGEEKDIADTEYEKRMREIFQDVYGKKRISPGKITHQSFSQMQHNCSVLPGSSGSVVMNPFTGEAVGLHVAGGHFNTNVAVTANVIRNRLTKLSLS